MYFLAVFHLGNSVSAALGGVLTGSRRQSKGAISAVVSYFLVGVPSSALLAFYFNLGVYGLVIGRLLGKFTHMIIYLTIFLKMDWKTETIRASTLLSSIKQSPSKAKRHQTNEEEEEDVIIDEEDETFDYEKHDKTPLLKL